MTAPDVIPGGGQTWSRSVWSERELPYCRVSPVCERVTGIPVSFLCVIGIADESEQ
ncbi:hypothetical protein BDK88_2852 [Natrinema hispanicum]|mgnify:CR=1|uniref:Uncharacterized protein n=1 Tax=Natrinema hispanicum TaxID=392421 RepID=A0A482YB93_9EURY|nr:hypothetical protein BDK88_2852 [Natrinema hispanicum]